MSSNVAELCHSRCGEMHGRKSGYRLPDADIDLAFQLAILRHCNEYGAECATSSLPVNRLKSPEH